jgi:hypothetical protein
VSEMCYAKALATGLGTLLPVGRTGKPSA